MRFETSQTTPPHLDRRLQLRMLSFVGMMAIIMFTLSVMNNRPGAGSKLASKSAGISPDSLNFEVRRESIDLKEGEFIASQFEDVSVVPEEELRGQSPRSRMETGSADRTPFAPRNKEQGRTGDSGSSLFRRKLGHSSVNERTVIDRSMSDRIPSGEPFPFDGAEDVRTNPSGLRPVAATDEVPAAAAPPAIDDWASEPAPSKSESIERDSGNFIRPIPRHRKPASRDDSFEDLRTPRMSNEPIPSMMSQRGSRPVVDDEQAWNSRSPSRQIEGGQGVFTSGSTYDNEKHPSPPVELRRRGLVTPFPPRQAEPVDAEIAKARIDKRYLDTVKDNTVGVRRDESEAFYWLLDHARRVPSANLQRAAQEDVQYINLMTEPDRFRGEPITIEGDLWRLYELDASKNGYGVAKIYEGWIFTGDSSNHPFRVVCTSLPSGIEPGENLRKPVKVTGYFFKKEGYQSNGGVHIAPTLLARRININTMPNGIPLTAGILPYMIGAIMSIGLALLVTIVGFAISDGRSSREGMDRLRRQPQMSFAGLEIAEPISVEESLRELANQQRGSAVTGAYGPLLSQQTIRELGVHDYSTSLRVQAETSRLQRHQQTGALQNWSARQQAAQAEIDALLQNNGDTKKKALSQIDDDQSLDQLDTANSLLGRELISSKPHVEAGDNDAVSFSLAPGMDRTRLKHETESLWPGTTSATEVAESSHAPAATEAESSSVEKEPGEDRGRRSRRDWRRGKSA